MKMRLFYKYILQVSAILYFVITITMSFDCVIRKDIKAMSEISERIEQNITESNFETAIEEYNKLSNKWISSKDKWLWMINHAIITDIDLTISNLGNYINNNLPDDAVVEKKKLLRQFDNVKDLDTVKLQNIF